MYTRFSLALLLSLFVNCAYAQTLIKLPKPVSHNMSVQQALQQRRSIRDYQATALSLQQVGQLLWAGQGITSYRGYRTAPSAGALYPLDIYLVAGKVTGLAPGIYQYLPEASAIKLIKKGDYRRQLMKASLNQSYVSQAPIDLVITAVFSRTTAKYGKRGRDYVFMDIGHAAQNILLQAVSLDLGAVPIGGFSRHLVQRVLGVQKGKIPLYVIPVGKPKHTN